MTTNKLTLIIILLLTFNSVAFSQTRSYELQGIGTISIPTDLELQSQQYRDNLSDYISQVTHKSVEEYSKDRFVFQQAGLNNGEAKAFKQYVRVIITKSPNNNNADSIPLNYIPTAKETQFLNKILKKAALQNLQQSNNVMLGWGGAQLVNSNDNQQSAVETIYLRRYKTNLPVVVYTYSFIDKNYHYSLTLSCRKQVLQYWSPIFKKIFKSFQIINED